MQTSLFCNVLSQVLLPESLALAKSNNFHSWDVHRVRMGFGKPGKARNFIITFSSTGKSWKKGTGPGKFSKSVKLRYM